MDLQNREIDGCVVVDINEPKFEHPKTQLLKNHTAKLIQDGKSHLVFNLSNVEMVDSFGIAVFISVLKQCKKAGGNLTLFGLNDQVVYLMELTRMDRVLDIWETEGQAIAHMNG